MLWFTALTHVSERAQAIVGSRALEFRRFDLYIVLPLCFSDANINIRSVVARVNVCGRSYQSVPSG